MPVLDPRRWSGRHSWFACGALAVATAAGVVVATRHASQFSGVEGLRAFLAAGFGLGMIGLAASLGGLTVPGFLIGLVFIAAGISSWTYPRAVTWALLGVEGVLFAIWTFPWLRDLRRLPCLGAAWLGLAYWFLGAIGAAAVLRFDVVAERVAYAGLFTVGALAVVTVTRKSGRDLSVGVVAALLVALGALLLVGCANALSDLHPVPHNGWGAHMEYRFWGGPGLLYHPNSIAVAAVVIAIRIGTDPAFERWQRYAAVFTMTAFLLLVNSRTGLVYLAAAAVVRAVLVWRDNSSSSRGHRRGAYFEPRVAWLAMPILLIVVIAIASGGTKFLGVRRYDNGAGDVTSGRWPTWVQVWHEFKADNVPEKVFGDASDARATVLRAEPGVPVASRPQLTTDNAPVGALRRGGIAGELAFLGGLVLMLWHATRGVRLLGGGRGRPPVWFTVAAVGSFPTMVSADWLLGGTGGTLWIFLVAGEAALLCHQPRARHSGMAGRSVPRVLSLP